MFGKYDQKFEQRSACNNIVGNKHQSTIKMQVQNKM